MRLVAVLCIGLALAAATDADAGNSTWEQRGWFVFRDPRLATSAFAQGVRAFVFNDWEQAERDLRSVINSAPRSSEAAAARAYLMVIYDLSGRYREALAAHDDFLANRRTKPARISRSTGHDIAAILSAYPDQRLVARSFSRVRFAKDQAGHLVLPVSINGKDAHCMVDTGSDISDLSESQAIRLGLTIHRITRALPTLDGRGTLQLTGIAVADELRVGDFRLRNVPFLLFREEEAEDGTIGTNILRAFESFGWTADGSFEIGFPAGPSNPPAANLCFTASGILLTETQFAGRRLTSMLDTGAAESFFKAGFAKAFPMLRRSGSKTKYDPGFIGRPPHEFDAVSLPEVKLTVGDCESSLRNVPVLLKQLGKNSWDYAHVGIDVLGKAARVSVDLNAMRLRVEGCRI